MKHIIYSGILGVGLLFGSAQAGTVPAEVQAVHDDLWNRFVQPNGLIIDYTGLDGTIDMPTAEDCIAAKPNAVSWWVPTENGAFFTGLYLEAMVKRAKFTGADEDKEKARKLAAGLLSCGTVGEQPGFVARYVLPDGKSHYSMGSDDQTGPWFSGLWHYVNSGIPTESERTGIVERMVETATALKKLRWLLPCDPIGVVPPGQYRGAFSGDDYRSASRLLFVTRIMAELTQTDAWKAEYQQALTAVPYNGDRPRIDVITGGMESDFVKMPSISRQQSWIFLNSQGMVRELYRLEQDPEVKEKYKTALQGNAVTVASLAQEVTMQSDWRDVPFKTDWRSLNELWKPQTTSEEATELATEQLKFWHNEGRIEEIKYRREPLSSAWLFFLAPEDNGQRSAVTEALEKLIAGTDWKKLNSSFGIFAEGAWYQMQEDLAGGTQ